MRHRRSFADAFNGNIPGELHCDEGGCAACARAAREDLPPGTAGRSDECVCVHAESNLVSFCALEGVPLKGAIVYCTDHPCVHCLKLLASTGVREVVYDRPYPAPDWSTSLRRMNVRRFHEATHKPDTPLVVNSAVEYVSNLGWPPNEL